MIIGMLQVSSPYLLVADEQGYSAVNFLRKILTTDTEHPEDAQRLDVIPTASFRVAKKFLASLLNPGFQSKPWAKISERFQRCSRRRGQIVRSPTLSVNRIESAFRHHDCAVLCDVRRW